MKIGVVAAVPQELGATLRALRARRRREGVHTVHLADPFIFVAGGMGPGKAASAARALAEAFGISGLVSTGFAGALGKSLETADLIVGGTRGFPATASLAARAREAAPGARAGDIVAVDRPLIEPAEMERAAAGGALAADMESAGVAGVAREIGIEFLCVKAVLDTPDAPLASRYEGVLPVLGEVARRPRVLAGIARDARRSRAAAARLAEFFRAFGRVL